MEMLLISSLWMSYVFAPFFLSQSVSFALKSCLMLVFLFLLCLHRKTNSSPIVFEIALPTFSSFLFIQMLCFHDFVAITKLAIDVVAFFVICRYATFQLFLNSSKFFRICTLLAIIPVIVECLKNGSLYFFRDSIAIGKQTLSGLFSISCFFCLFSTLFEKKKKRNLILLGIFTFVNLFIVQSKTSLLILAVDMCLFARNRVARSQLKRIILYFLFGCFFLLIFFPSIALPDDVRYGINHLLGVELFSTDYSRSLDRLSMTYDVRDDMKNYCLGLFKSSPICGVGIGNFAVLNHFSGNYFNELGETESSWLSIIVEGGILYLTTMLVFFVTSIWKFYKMRLKNKENPYYLAGIILFLNFAIMFIFNDFMDSVFWINCGLMMGGLLDLESQQRNNNFG